MTVIPASDSPDDRPGLDMRRDCDSPIPEWAPMEPLPSAEMFLATFAGMQLVTANEILSPAFDLVACQREERLADAVLTDETSSLEDLRVAGRRLISARTDISMLIMIIDEAVNERLLQHRSDHLAAPEASAVRDVRSPVPLHTESVGDIAARMAELWEILHSTDSDRDCHPEAELLVQLCDGYDTLIAEVESDRRRLPGCDG